MPDNYIETPVLEELTRRCERPNVAGFVRAYEQADGDRRVEAIKACIVRIFETSVDETDQD